MSTQTMLRVSLPDKTLTAYETQAARMGKTVEQVIEERLVKFAGVESTKPIVLNDMARQHLERLLGRNLTTEDELVSAVQRALSCQIDGVEIPVTPYLLDRLKTRCIGVEFGKFMQTTVKRLIEEFVGVR